MLDGLRARRPRVRLRGHAAAVHRRIHAARGHRRVALHAGWAKLWETPQILALCALSCAWIVRTIPYVERYGIDAIRDAAIYYYSAFAFIVAGLLIADPRRLATLLGYLPAVRPAFPRRHPRRLRASIALATSLPRWPGGRVPISRKKRGT